MPQMLQDQGEASPSELFRRATSRRDSRSVSDSDVQLRPRLNLCPLCGVARSVGEHGIYRRDGEMMTICEVPMEAYNRRSQGVTL